MKEELLNELVSETRMEDIAERYQEIVKIVGIANFVKLSNYARGDEIYFPKIESVVSPARNRRIKNEFNGSNDKELAEKYNLTLKQIWNILKDEPPIGQMTLNEMLGM